MKLEITIEEPYMQCIEVTLEPTGIRVANLQGFSQLLWDRPVFIHHSGYGAVKLLDEDTHSCRVPTHLVNGIILQGRFEYEFVRACMMIQTAMYI